MLTMKSNPELLDRCWAWLAMALVGEDLDEKDEICGAVVSLRAKIDRIQLWLRTKEDIERINSIGRKLVKLLDLQNESGIGLEFQVRPRPGATSIPRVMGTVSPLRGLTSFVAVQYGRSSYAHEVHFNSTGATEHLQIKRPWSRR